MLVSASSPLNVLDNIEFAMFVEKVSSQSFNLPSRGYMTNTVMPILHKAGFDAAKGIIQNIQHISLTTDIWKSFSKISYITVTCHIIDDNLQLHKFLLDTREIKKRHTSIHLYEHIKEVLIEWGIEESSEGIVINHHNTNPNDIEAEDPCRHT